MKRNICLVFVMVLLVSLGCVSFADGALDVVGTVDGQIYTSKTLLLRAEFPEDWVLLSDEQIAAEMEFPEEYSTREGLARLLEEYYGTCALSAESTDGSKANLNLMIQDIVSPEILSEQDFYDVSVDSIPETLTKQGFQNVAVKQGEFRLAVYGLGFCQEAGLGMQSESGCQKTEVGNHVMPVPLTVSAKEKTHGILNVHRHVMGCSRMESQECHQLMELLYLMLRDR